jgi:xanthine dehydrogenase small subunit
MRHELRFMINGREHAVAGSAALQTLANYLREQGATGTKIVCAEGDCGACTVLVRHGGSDFQAVNSCIQSLVQLDGYSIVTVEGIADGAALHPVQRSMIEHYGSQCGYCTPGFVVAMAALTECGKPLDEQAVRDGLTGNLCRCTGYEPIMKATLATDASIAPRLCDRYPAMVDDGEAVFIESAGRTFFAPVSLDEAIRFKRERAPVTIVQGGTDVGVWVNKHNFAAPALLSLAKIVELDAIVADDAQIAVGANASLTAFEAALRERIPELYRILKIFGSPQIKNAGTLVGNIANGSPIADTLPFLFVAGAELEIAGASGRRRVHIERFYRGYKTFDLEPDEVITKVLVPTVTTKGDRVLRLYKVSRRTDLDISAFTAAILLRIDGQRIAGARIAYGGVAPVVMRMPKLEAFLTGKPVELETFETAGAVARSEVSPISDVRGSREYRLQLCENILQKFYFEAFTEPVPIVLSGRRSADRPFTGAGA